ncbi:hypothetical protein [Microbacterium sp. LWH10-1.2]|uniref:hypothetical protein n=1 Tax=Microbacterium sp. LWH10-1.2 TaxID=3135255 RepID=UPI00313A1C52
MSPDLFQIVLWGSTGLLLAGLCTFWWRQDVRERRDAELVKRWRKGTVWSADTSARVVRVARVEPGRAWLDGDHEIEVILPARVTDLDTGWYLHVTGWVPAARAVSKGESVTLDADHVLDAFPPHTPALDDKLAGRGERRPRFFSRLLGLRGM